MVLYYFTKCLNYILWRRDPKEIYVQSLKVLSSTHLSVFPLQKWLLIHVQKILDSYQILNQRNTGKTLYEQNNNDRGWHWNSIPWQETVISIQLINSGFRCLFIGHFFPTTILKIEIEPQVLISLFSVHKITFLVTVLK